MLKLRSAFLVAAAGLFCLLFLAGAAPAQTLYPVSGNGQLICPLCPNGVGVFAPLVVMVKDANGNPLANQTVTWTLTAGQGLLNNSTTVTDSTGTTSNVVVVNSPLVVGSFGVSYTQATVLASIGASSVTFTETQAATGPGGVQLVFAQLISPSIGTTYTGGVGTQATPVVQVLVNSLNGGGGVPGVELRINAPDPTQGASVACPSVAGLAPNTAITDSTGTATCNLIFTGRPGSGQFSITVGNNYVFPPGGGFNFTVTAGPASTIRIISGNNQSGNPGSPLPGVLTAEVDDLAGNPLPGVGVTWGVASGSATLSNTQTTTDASGRASTNVTLGTGGGPVLVKIQVASNTAISATFTATVNIVITGLSKLSGDTQSATVNTAFAQPLVVQVMNQAQPVAGAAVTFAVTSGSATVATSSTTTNAQGQASTTVQAGANAGPVVVTATAGSYSQIFNLTVIPPGPSITSNSFYNAAGFQQGWISPCSLATIVAPGLAPGIQGAVVPYLFGPLPYVVANVSVQFGNSYAPIYSVVNSYTPGNDAVTVEVPCELTPGTIPVTVRVGGGSANVSLPILTVSPGVFQTVMSDNQKRAVLLRPDGSYVELENPARRGEIIRAFVTGLGPVTPPIATNSSAIPGTDSNVSSTIVVGVNNSGVRVVGAKYAENLIGVYEVDFQIPSDAQTGNNIPFAVAVQQGNNLVFGNPSMIPIQ